MLERSIADEVEAAIKAGSTDKHLDTLKQVTDLFLLSADGYSGEQIELFGDVLERLIKTVELRALADVAARIALDERFDLRVLWIVVGHRYIVWSTITYARTPTPMPTTSDTIQNSALAPCCTGPVSAGWSG